MIHISFIPTEFEDVKIEGTIPFSVEDTWLLPYIAQFAEEHKEQYHQICQEKIIVYVNGFKVEVDDWNEYVVKDEDEIRIINSVGKGAGIMQTILGAVMIAVAYINPFGYLTGPVVSAMYLAGASMMIGGVIQMLFAPTMPMLPSFDGASSSSYSWDGAQTTSMADRPVGVVYGEHVVGGNVITAFVTTDGDKNYLNVLIGLSEGEIEGIVKKDRTGVCTLENNGFSFDVPDIEINNQSIVNYAGVTWYAKTGTNNQSSIPGFNTTHTFYSENKKIGIGTAVETSTAGKYQVTGGVLYTTNGNQINEISLQLEIPSLYALDGNGNPVENTVKYRVYYRKTGDVDFRLAPLSGRARNPEWTVWNAAGELAGWFPTKRDWINGYYLIGGSADRDDYGVRCDLNRNKYGTPNYQETPHPEPEQYLFGVATTEEQIITEVSKTTVRRYCPIIDLPAGQYDVRIIRTSPETKDFRQSSDFYLSGVDEIIYVDFQYPNTAILGLKFLATDQLSGGVPNITTRIRGKKVRVPLLTYDYAGTVATYNDTYYDVGKASYVLDANPTVRCSLNTDYTTWPTQWCQRPVWCLLDYLTNKRFGLGHYITDDLIDWIYAVSSSKYADAITSPPTTTTLVEAISQISYTIIDKRIFSNVAKAYYTVSGQYLKVTMVGADTTVYQWTNMSNATLHYSGINLPTPVVRDSNYDMKPLVYSEACGFTTNSNTPNGSYCILDFGKFCYFSSVMFNSISSTATFKIEVGGYGNVAVDTGTVGGEKRFQCDGVWDTAQSGFDAIVDFCKLFRAWIIWSEGKLKFIVDKDEDPVQSFNMSNIVSGSFSQTFAAKSSIPNVIEIQFADQDDEYKLVTREVVDQDAWTAGDAKNVVSVNLKGITRSSQAVREGKFYLNTAKYRTKAISFKGVLDAVHCQAGDVIAFQHDVPQWAYGGRVVTASTVANTITLDQSVALTASVYKIYYQTSAGSFVTATVTNTTATRILTPSPAITSTTTPAVDALWSLGKVGQEKQEFKILSISRGEDNEVNLSALEHNPSIYNDSGIAIPPQNTSALPNFNAIPQPVTELVLSLLVNRPGFIVSFNVPQTDPAYSYAEIQVSDNGVTYYTYTTSNDAKDIFIDGLPGQTKYVRVYSCNRAGRRSNYSVSGSIVIRGDFYPSNVMGLELFNQGNDTDFEGRDCKVTWKRSEQYGGNDTTSSAGLNPYLATKDYKVEIWVNGIATRSEITTDNWYLYTYEKNKEDNVAPAVTFTIKIYARSTSNTLSKTAASVEVTNTIPNDVAGLSATAVVGGVSFAWDRNTESDFRCYAIRTKVGSGVWSSWGDVEDNKLIRTLNAAEVTASTNLATVYVEVKVKDLYNQTSATAAAANAKANTISDNIFQLVSAVDSGITGTVSSLYDGDIDSGGVVIT